ncbi:hypothetical protein M432DRAFT_640223 [Thermoascus aurantiacus ATCC 26904]
MSTRAPPEEEEEPDAGHDMGVDMNGGGKGEGEGGKNEEEEEEEADFRAEFFSYDEALEKLTFRDDREVLKRAIMLVESS